MPVAIVIIYNNYRPFRTIAATLTPFLADKQHSCHFTVTVLQVQVISTKIILVSVRRCNRVDGLFLGYYVGRYSVVMHS